MTDPHEEELWRPVVGYEGVYEVSNIGRVRSLTRVVLINGRNRTYPQHVPGILMAIYYREKRPCVHLRGRDKMHKYRRVYHLVLEAFVGPRPDGYVACHNDGDTTNSKVVNLRWDTQKANMQDMKAHGTHVRGSRSVGAKITELEAVKIREIYSDGGTSQRRLAGMFGVSQSVIREIIIRKKWAFAEDDLRAMQ